MPCTAFASVPARRFCFRELRELCHERVHLHQHHRRHHRLHLTSQSLARWTTRDGTWTGHGRDKDGTRTGQGRDMDGTGRDGTGHRREMGGTRTGRDQKNTNMSTLPPIILRSNALCAFVGVLFFMGEFYVHFACVSCVCVAFVASGLVGCDLCVARVCVPAAFSPSCPMLAPVLRSTTAGIATVRGVIGIMASSLSLPPL